MCVPGAQSIASIAVNTASSIGKAVLDYSQEVKNNEYRSQVAINNIKSAQDEAIRLKQLGIEKAREERISGIQKSSAILARNASSAADVYSGSSYLNYENAYNASFSAANDILNQYDVKADSYFQKANSYLQNYNFTREKSKTSLYKSALNSLGGYSKVASNWYLDN